MRAFTKTGYLDVRSASTWRHALTITMDVDCGYGKHDNAENNMAIL
jgi:hypothetical protein